MVASQRQLWFCPFPRTSASHTIKRDERMCRAAAQCAALAGLPRNMDDNMHETVHEKIHERIQDGRRAGAKCVNHEGCTRATDQNRWQGGYKVAMDIHAISIGWRAVGVR